MKLFLIRHAEAVPRTKGRLDAARPLTKRGKRRFRRAVRGLEALGWSFDRVLHSPWRRAVETAAALGHLASEETVVAPELAQTPTRAFIEALEGERVALVGHQPWLGELLGLLVFGEPERGASFELGKGAVVWLEGEPRAGGMAIHAVVPPRVLRALGRRRRR
jgi:phosphohistidine phosphatase